MSLHDTISSERIQIGFFGMCNVGKSSTVNAITEQNVSVVSRIKGTTTDPVKKAMELLPLGPVMIIDTPGFNDDTSILGNERTKKAQQILSTIDIAILVVNAVYGLTTFDKKLLNEIKQKDLPYLIVYNKADLIIEKKALKNNEIYISAQKGTNIDLLKNRIANLLQHNNEKKKIVSDLLHPGDTVLLVVPLDSSAPKGRLILPQQQTIRDLLDAKCISIVTPENEVTNILKNMNSSPTMVITDSQLFGTIDKYIPKEIPLTSFSILFARYKGNLQQLVSGAAVLSSLKDYDNVLICEGCTHHRQCNDIGTIKLPTWIKHYCNTNPNFHFTSGKDFPNDLSQYRLIIHCGGCMLSEKEMKNRLIIAQKANIPIVNYGITIAQIHGLLKRSLSLFPEINNLLN